jgi:hypothetical protein
MKVTRFDPPSLKLRRNKDLEIWQEARELCKYVFEITEQEPFKHPNTSFRNDSSERGTYPESPYSGNEPLFLTVIPATGRNLAHNRNEPRTSNQELVLVNHEL